MDREAIVMLEAMAKSLFQEAEHVVVEWDEGADVEPWVKFILKTECSHDDYGGKRKMDDYMDRVARFLRNEGYKVEMTYSSIKYGPITGRIDFQPIEE